MSVPLHRIHRLKERKKEEKGFSSLIFVSVFVSKKKVKKEIR